jgi:sterol desaturase/sphingolipid hydroxylase (fatty acid hydroxylase superfamily)
MPITGQMFWIAAPIFLLLVSLEIFCFHRNRLTGYSWRESLTTIGIGLGHKVSGLFCFSFIALAMSWIWDHRLFDITLNHIGWIALLFIAVEFNYYWYHRFSHTIRWMWASHCVHHSPIEFNILASFRLSWTSTISGDFLLFLPLVWLGFQPAAIGSMLAFNLLYQSWVHTELIPKLGPLDQILNTPSNHRVHHASNEIYLDKNYGGVLMIFDKLFGTYATEEENSRCYYGLVTPVESVNPIWIAFHEWISMATDLTRSRNFLEAVNYLFGHPGWRPENKGEEISTQAKDIHPVTG